MSQAAQVWCIDRSRGIIAVHDQRVPSALGQEAQVHGQVFHQGIQGHLYRLQVFQACDLEVGVQPSMVCVCVCKRLRISMQCGTLSHHGNRWRRLLSV